MINSNTNYTSNNQIGNFVEEIIIYKIV